MVMFYDWLDIFVNNMYMNVNKYVIVINNK